MSSILRGMRNCLSLTSRVRHGIHTRDAHRMVYRQAGGMSSAFARSLSTDPAARQEDFRRPVSRLSSLDRHLEVMDSDVRWRNRIEKSQIETAMKLARKEGSVTDQQALMMLRGTGSLMVKESPVKRMEVFNDVWKTLQDLGVPLRTSHYNSSLRAQLDNEHPFVVTDVLAEMEASEATKPNKVTFKLLVARYCEDGDIEGATKVLQFMKSENMPINEGIFNSLIKGHLKKGDIEGANGVMESMRSNGLDPTNETYGVILACHAENGNMEAIEETLKNAQNDEVDIASRHILAGVIELAEHGHNQFIDQLLDHVQPSSNYDLMTAVHQLISRGHDSVAQQVYSRIQSDDPELEVRRAGARSVIRTMVLNDRPIDVIKSMVADMMSSGRIIDEDIGLIALFAATYEKPYMALEAFKLMHAQKLPVRPHFFWPVFIQLQKARDTDGVYGAVSVLAELAGSHRDTVTTLYDKVFAKLLQTGADPTAVVTRFQESGVNTEVLNSVQLLHLINSGNMAEAAQFAPPFSFQPPWKQPGTTIKDTLHLLIGQLQKGNKKAASGFNGDLLNMILLTRNMSVEAQTELLEAWLQEELPLNKGVIERAQKKLLDAGVDEAMVQRLSGMEVLSRRSRPLTRGEAEEMTMDSLEQELKARKPRDRDVWVLQKQLLLKYCSAGDVAKVDELRTHLEEGGFSFDSVLLRHLGFVAARFKNSLEEALKYKNELEAKFPEYSPYARLVLAVAELQAKEGKFDEVFAAIEQYADKHGETMGFGQTYDLKGDIDRLVAGMRENATPGQIRHLVDVLSQRGYIKPGVYNLLQDVVRVYLQKEDLDGLMEVLEQYHSQHSRVPAFSEVFQALIMKEDAEKLQKVVDMVTSLYGEMQVLHYLVISFINCGKSKKARKILEVPGMRAYMPVLKDGIDRMIQRDKEEELRQLIDVTKNLFGIDRDEMLFGLIRLHASRKDAAMCMDVLTMYEEEGVKPRARTLRYLAKVLESSGMEVPFDVPTVTQRPAEELRTSSTLEQAAEKAIKLGEIETFCDLLKARSEENTMSVDFVTEAAIHVKSTLGNLPFRRMLYVLGEEADVESLQAILDTDQLTTTQSNLLKKQLCLARISRGQTEEIVKEMEAAPSLINDNLSVPVIMTIAEKEPQLMARVEAVVERHLVENPDSIWAAGNLFIYYTETGERAKAEALWMSNENLRLKVKLMETATKLGQRKDEATLRWLLGLLREVSSSKASVAFSHLIALRNSMGDWQGALAMVEEARQAGLEYTGLWGSAMRQLEEQILAEGQQPPWVVGLFDKGRREQITSASEKSRPSPGSTE